MATKNWLIAYFQGKRNLYISYMVDVPVGQIARVEKLTHRYHPEAVTGGVGWHIDALQI